MSRNPTLAEVLEAHGRGILSRVRTGIPAQVTAYDPVTNTCDVEIVVSNPVWDRDDERTFEKFPPIGNVPVLWPRAGGYVMTMPLGPGDFVWLAFSELPLGEWRSTGQPSEPLDARRHSIGYPYATPGAFPDTKPLSPSPLDVAARSAGPLLGSDTGPSRIEISDAGIKLGSLAVMPVALAPPILAFITAVSVFQAAVAAFVPLANAKIASIPAPLTPPEIAALNSAATAVTAAATAAATAGVAAVGTGAATLAKAQ